jgi:hypothetical protein
VANEWNKTALAVVEFEAMLRRRLRSGAAPVVACAGFDLDAASAYLEGALIGSQRAGYESHLAGCAACRRHMIELSRLAQIAPQTEARPATTPDRIPAWDRWKEALTGWFNPSAWNLKWQVAGAAGAAFTVLIAALVAQSWRPTSDQIASAVATSATPMLAAGADVQPLRSHESPPQDTQSTVAMNLSEIQQGQSGTPVPNPPIPPREGDLNIATPPLNKFFAAIPNQSSEPPDFARSDVAEAKAAQETADRAIGLSSTDFREGAREQTANEIFQGPRITPPRGYDPMNPDPLEPAPSRDTLTMGRMLPVNPQPDSRPKPQPDKSSSGFNLGSITGAIKRTLYPARKSSFINSESERKTKPDKREKPEDEAPNPMQKMVRNKIFCFEKCKGPDLEKVRGMWIDREYDFEKHKWNVWTLKRGDEQYKKILADEPLLKEFFDDAPILIVWGDRVYKVLN